MGILDADGFAGGELRLDLAAAHRAFESLDTLLSFEQRVAFAYRIAVANIAEEVLNVAIRHGVDPRDFSVVAYGAAGPMLLPAALELLHARRIVVPPYPGLFSAIGLLSTDLVYYESRSAYVVLTPEAAPQLDSVFAEMEERLRERVGAGADGLTVRRTIDGRLLGQSWETPFVELPGGSITEATIPELVERFHAEYERRYGNRFPYMPVQGVTYRVQMVVPADKVEYAAQDGETVTAEPGRVVPLRYLGADVVEAGEYQRETLPPGAHLVGPAVIREPLSTTLVCPGQVAEVGRFGELVIEEAAT